MFKLSKVSIRWENVTDSRTSTLEVQFCYHLCDNFDNNKILIFENRIDTV